MKGAEAHEMGGRLLKLAEAGQVSVANDLLLPLFARRTPFPMLERIGEALAPGSAAAIDPLLDHIAGQRNEGGWVIIGSTLRGWLGRDPVGALRRCRRYIVEGDVWYAADILAERVPGSALVSCFEVCLPRLTSWRSDANRWVRRALGVAMHFWAKRSMGASELLPQARGLLTLLEPLIEERETDAVKGIGWGLKTLGRYYPDLVSGWLGEQAGRLQRRPRALMMRKALTYLTEEQRARAMGGGGS